MVSPFINDPTREIGYVAGRSSLWVLGKQSAESIGETVAHSIKDETFRNVSSAAGALSGVAGLVTIGLAAAVSAALTQMDYIHRTDSLKALYKEELSVRLKKPLGKLTYSDLDELAKNNAVIHEEMARSRKQRNYGIALSCIASMVSLAVIILALPTVLGVLAGTGGALVANEALGVIGGTLVKAAVGLTTYHLVKDPLHYVADKLFNLDEKTTNDYIVNIKRDREAGKIISREQVMSVFAAANPELGRYIVAEYGKYFDDLTLADKQQATNILGRFMPIDRLVLDINSGKVNVSELAFAVEGQISGVNHETFIPEKPKLGLLGVMLAGVGNMFGLHSHKKHHHHEVSVSAIAQVASRITEYQPGEDKAQFVKALEQSRGEATLGIGIHN